MLFWTKNINWERKITLVKFNAKEENKKKGFNGSLITSPFGVYVIIRQYIFQLAIYFVLFLFLFFVNLLFLQNKSFQAMHIACDSVKFLSGNN